jgi:hypothetical protein
LDDPDLMMSVSRFLVVLVLVLVFPLVHISSAISAEKQALNCTEFLENNVERAGQGDAVAQRTLGGFYSNGFCFDQQWLQSR